MIVRDKNGRFHRCTDKDEEYLSGEWVPFMTGMVNAIDKNTGEHIPITMEEYRSNKDKYESFSKDFVVAKDKNGNIYRVKKTDERYINGELKVIWDGKSHKDETKKKMSETHKLNCHQQGEKNSQYGTCWIYNPETEENIKIKKDELDEYLTKGFKKGRIQRNLEKSKYDDLLNKDEIIGMVSMGMSQKSIARKLNIPPMSLSRYLKRNNIL